MAFAPVLPVTRLEANTGATRHVGSMVLLPSDTYSDLLRYLARMAQVAVDDVTPFFQRSATKEIVRITGDVDLRCEQVVGLVVVVGLCTVCDKEVDGVPVEFHLCQVDEVIQGTAGFRSKAGPIQCSATKETVRLEGDENLRRERPVGPVIVVGLCAACNKERDGVPVEFHPCRLDEVIGTAAGFRSSVGPIQRPPRSIVG